MTVKELKKRHDEKVAKCNQLTADIEKYKAIAIKRKIDAAKAAEAGNIAEYRSNMDACKEAEDIVHVESVQLENYDVKEDASEVRAAWEDFCKTEVPKIIKAADAYEKKLRALSREYFNVLDQCKEFFIIRNTIADYADLEHSSLDASQLYKLTRVDVDLYKNKGFITDEEAIMYRTLVQSHR